MSLNYVPLNVVGIQDPRTKIDNQQDRKYAVVMSSGENNQRIYTSSSVSTATINFNTNPSSTGVIVDRQVKLYLPIRLSITGIVQPGYVLLQPGKFALRQFPIHNMLDKIILSVNNCSITQDISEIISPMLRIGYNEDVNAFNFSNTPTCLDLSQNYSDLYGSVRNPLSQAGDTTFMNVSNRGAFSGMTIVTNPQNNTVNPAQLTAVVDIGVTEFIMMSPLLWDKQESGWYGVSTMDWVFSFLNNAAVKLFSLAPDASYTYVNSSIEFSNFQSPAFTYLDAQPLLYINNITPNALSNLPPPDSMISYSYYPIDKYVTDINAPLAYGAGVAQVVSNNLQLSSIPEKIVIFIRPSQYARSINPSLTDTFFAINRCTIQFANKQNLLSQLDKRGLYEIAVNNGVRMSWSDWSGQPQYKVGGSTFDNNDRYGGVGSILPLIFGSDIPTVEGDASGVGYSSYNLQITVDYENCDPSLSLDNIPLSLYIFVISAGVFNIGNGTSNAFKSGVVSRQDVLNLFENPGATLSLTEVEDNTGGFLSKIDMDKVKDKASKANKWLRDTKAISRGLQGYAKYTPIQRGSKAIGTLGNIASKFGYGLEGGCGDCQGDGMVGGGKMRRSTLKNRYMR